MYKTKSYSIQEASRNMRVSFYYGKVGSGKTLHAVFDCYLDHYVKHRTICTNMKSVSIPNTVHITPFDLLRALAPDNPELVDSLLAKLNPNLKQSSFNTDNEKLLNDKSIKKTLLLDEIGKWWDSRNSYSWLNRFLAYFVDQSRKRNLNLVFTDQHIGALDIRGRQSVDKLVRCVCQYIPDTEIPYKFHYWILDTNFETTKYYTIEAELAKFIYPYYKTEEHIVPAEILLAE